MPSPLAHVTMGYVIYRTWPERCDPTGGTRVLGVPSLLVASLGLCLAADLDAAVGILAGNLGRYHNNFMGSPVFGVLFALLIGVAARVVGGRFGRWFLLALVCYQTHVVMDFFTVGRGVMLLWPWTDARFQPPFELFYGLRWSDGPISHRHLWTLLTESAFAAVVVSVAVLATRGRRRAPEQVVGR